MCLCTEGLFFLFPFQLTQNTISQFRLYGGGGGGAGGGNVKIFVGLKI